MTNVQTAGRPGSILVVDDDSAIRQALRITLRSFGFEIAEASTGEQAIDLMARRLYDAVLLDMNMPGMGGVPACREIRRRFPALPILMLTIQDSQEDKLGAFEAGADDYVTKPFHMSELTARVRAALRRSSLPQETAGEWIQIGDIRLDAALRTVTKQGRRVHLTPREFDLLHYLMTNAGKPLAHGTLLTTIWGPEYGRELDYLRTFVHQLRRKLEDDPSHPSYLVTEAWYGYRFRSPE
ncbi:MAG: response regulator transcription factor [Bryobacteraceae bacterium]|jgi:two-component system KDP operon response regulator KdpE